MSDREQHDARRGIKTRGERAIQIGKREANARLDLGSLGLEQHYLGPSHYRGEICLSNAERSAIMMLRPPVAASFNKVLHHPLEISRLLRTMDRVEPLSAFVAAGMRWVRTFAPSTACIIAYSDPGAVNSDTGSAHNGGIYLAANFVHVGDAPHVEPHWLDRDGNRRNRQEVFRMLGTASRDLVAARRPRWQYVAGSRKRLFVYPMAMSVADVVAALAAVPRSGRTRPFKLSAE